MVPTWRITGIGETDSSDTLGLDPELLAELNGMTLEALKQRALGMECEQKAVENVDVSDNPKQTAIDLIRAKDLKLKLKAMNLRVLKQTALRMGCEWKLVDDVDDSDDPKHAAIDMILVKVTREQALTELRTVQKQQTDEAMAAAKRVVKDCAGKIAQCAEENKYDQVSKYTALLQKIEEKRVDLEQASKAVDSAVNREDVLEAKEHQKRCERVRQELLLVAEEQRKAQMDNVEQIWQLKTVCLGKLRLHVHAENIAETIHAANEAKKIKPSEYSKHKERIDRILVELKQANMDASKAAESGNYAEAFRIQQEDCHPRLPELLRLFDPEVMAEFEFKLAEKQALTPNGPDVFVCSQMTELVKKKIVELGPGSINAALPDFNRKGLHGKSINLLKGTNIVNIPCYGPNLTENVKELLDLPIVRDAAKDCRFMLPRFVINEVTREKCTLRGGQLIDEIKARTCCEDSRKAVKTLEDFVEKVKHLKESDFVNDDFSPLPKNPCWIDKIQGIDADWRELLHKDTLLRIFGFSERFCEQWKDIKMKTEKEQKEKWFDYAGKWLTKAFDIYSYPGSMADVVNLIFVMLGKDKDAMGGQYKVDIDIKKVERTVKEFTDVLREEDWDKLVLIPTHIIHDSEMDDMLAWLLLRAICSNRQQSLCCQVQLPVKPLKAAATLQEKASRGALRISVSSTVGWQVGDRVQIDSGECLEVGVIDSINLAETNEINLETSLRFHHDVGATMQMTTADLIDNGLLLRNATDADAEALVKEIDQSNKDLLDNLEAQYKCRNKEMSEVTTFRDADSRNFINVSRSACFIPPKTYYIVSEYEMRPFTGKYVWNKDREVFVSGRKVLFLHNVSGKWCISLDQGGKKFSYFQIEALNKLSMPHSTLGWRFLVKPENNVSNAEIQARNDRCDTPSQWERLNWEDKNLSGPAAKWRALNAVGDLIHTEGDKEGQVELPLQAYEKPIFHFWVSKNEDQEESPPCLKVIEGGQRCRRPATCDSFTRCQEHTRGTENAQQKIFQCPNYKDALAFLNELGVEDWIDHKWDRCYCSDCRCYPAERDHDMITERALNEYDDYDFPQIAPRGWVGFGVVVSRKLRWTEFSQAATWPIRFHGCKPSILPDILRHGCIARPGDRLITNRALTSANCRGRNNEAVFYTSPTVNYAGLQLYARAKPMKSKPQMVGQVVLQCNQDPDSIVEHMPGMPQGAKLGPETMGFKDKYPAHEVCRFTPLYGTGENAIEIVSQQPERCVIRRVLIRTFRRDEPPTKSDYGGYETFRSPVDWDKNTPPSRGGELWL